MLVALVAFFWAQLVTVEPKAASAWSLQAVAIGDSVMLGAQSQLYARGIVADAVESRQWSTGVAIAQSMAAQRRLTPTVVIHLGTNGPITSGMFDQMMYALSPAKHVIFLNMKEPRFWEAGNNAVLADGVRRWHKARLVDWHDAALAHPEWTWGDAIHLTPLGAVAYADLVAAAVHAVNKPPPKPVPHIGSPESLVDGVWKHVAVADPLAGKPFCSSGGGCSYVTGSIHVRVHYDAPRNGHVVEFDVGGYSKPGNIRYWRFLISLLPPGATKPTCKNFARSGMPPLNGGPAKACVYRYRATTILVAQALGGSTAFPGEGVVTLDGALSDIMPSTAKRVEGS